MQVMRQRIKNGMAVLPASTYQRDFTAEVNALLNDALPVAIVRQLVSVIGAQTPLSTTVVPADATLHNCQLAQHCKYILPLAFIGQQLPRRSRQPELIEQLLLRQTVSNNGKDVAVNEGIMTRQLARQGRLWPAFNLRGDHTLVKRHGFRFVIQPDGPDGNTQRLTGLTQHTA